MAESAYCDTSNPYIKYWMEVTETSVDTENNTSTVNVKIYATRINDYPEATNYGGLCYLYFYNESTGEWEDKGDNRWDYPECPIWSHSDTKIYDDDFVVPHNDDGTKTLRLRSGFSLYYNGGYKLYADPEYQEFRIGDTYGVTLTPIQTGEHNNVTVSIRSVTHNSVSIRVSASNTSDQWWYVIKDFNANWVKFSTQAGTHQDVTITGLTPSTEYEIRGSAQIENSEVYGNSSVVKFKTNRYRHRNGNIVTLYEENEVGFVSNGLGVLSDVLSCVVTEERNGSFELEMTYPIDGIHYSDITSRRILYANPNKHDYPQPFRIYSISKPLNGIITVNAEHISYDLSGYTVTPFSANTAKSAIANLAASIDKVSGMPDCPFSFYTDIELENTVDMVVKVPSSVRYVLGGSDDSFLNKYGGEIQFDCFDVKILEERGDDRDVVIRYGKNLTDLKQEENCANVYTYVRPYYYKEDKESSTLVTVEGKVVPVSSETPAYVKILSLDLTSYFDETPSQSDLETLTQAWIAANNLAIPEVSLTVSFVDISTIPEYKDFKNLETVRLCDIVTVEFPKLGVNAKAKCVKTVYDVLTGQYNSIDIGVLKNDLSSTISDQGKAISGNVTRSALETAISDASKMLTNSAVASYGVTTQLDGGQPGYLRIGRLYVIGGHANSPIKIEVYNRSEWCPIQFYLCFTNDGNVSNVTVNKFKYFDASGATVTEAFIYEVAQGTWDVYVKKEDYYDCISAIWNIPYYMRDRVVLDSASARLSSIPSGAISATSF